MFSQILNPKRIEIFWLFSRFLYIFLIVWLIKFCELKYIGVFKKLTFTFVIIDFSFFIICFHSDRIDFLTMDVSDIQFSLHKERERENKINQCFFKFIFLHMLFYNNKTQHALCNIYHKFIQTIYQKSVCITVLHHYINVNIVIVITKDDI